MILSHVIQGQVVGFQILLDSLHPHEGVLVESSSSPRGQIGNGSQVISMMADVAFIDNR